MKNFILLVLLVITTIVGCKKENMSIVDEQGLTQDIHNLVPDSILNEIKEMGMPIYGGENPPNIEGSYSASPFVLKQSNIPSDLIGYYFSELLFKFYNQNNSNLTISMDYLNGFEEGTGLGGYIVGENNYFTAFMRVSAKMNEDNSTVLLVQILSGQYTEDGIKDFYFANFMIDNDGNHSGYWIDNGQGRIIYDSDGFSEKIPGIKKAINTGKNISRK